MKKIVTLGIAVLLLTVVGLSGCNEADKNSSSEDKQLSIVLMNSQREEILTVNEGDTFIIKIIDENETPIEGVAIKFGTYVDNTNSDGEVIITAPIVTSDMPYSIEASYTGYISANGTITVLSSCELFIELDSSSVEAGTEFLVTIRDESGSRRVGVTVTFNGQTYISSIDGEVTFTAPDIAGEYTITSSYHTCTNATATITVNKESSEPLDGVTMTIKEYLDDQMEEYDWSDYYTRLQETLDDGDTLNIQDYISQINYISEDDKTSITFCHQEGYSSYCDSFYFEGDITDQYEKDDEVRITAHIKHVTFSDSGFDYDMEIFEEQWESVSYFNSRVNHFTEYQDGLKAMSSSVIEKL